MSKFSYWKSSPCFLNNQHTISVDSKQDSDSVWNESISWNIFQEKLFGLITVLDVFRLRVQVLGLFADFHVNGSV